MHGFQVNRGMYLADNSAFAPLDLYIVNNIVTNCLDGFYTNIANAAVDAPYWVIDNNCWHDFDEASPFWYNGTKYAHAGWETVIGTAGAVGIGGGVEADAVLADPLFTDVDDFTLQSGSPCVNAGTNAGATDDLAGNPRPVGVTDIGAYERQ